MNKVFTVFTPTFNRAHTLHRVFDSLMQQSCRDFEWLIVDDGSTDGTMALVDGWKQKAYFPIRYCHQTNQGKHIAFNRAVNEAEGRFFVPLDSDDACLPQALERFLMLWNDIPDYRQEQFSGICVLCQDQNGRTIGDEFPKSIFDSNSCELYYKYGVKEKWGFHRTEVLRKYPFPEIKGVHFIPESIIWHAIAKKYQIRCANEALRIYFIEGNSLSTTSEQQNNRKAKLEYYRWALKNDIKWFFYAPLIFVKYVVQYVRYSFGYDQ
jgi:glycosyltransferase involved in cell wall biosynthesis